MANKNNDKVILELQKEIEKKKRLIKDQKFVPLTNCSLDFEGNRINLHVANKDTLLLHIIKLTTLQKTLKELYPEESLTISGYSVEDWLTDLQSKFNIVNINNEKSRLKTLELKLHNLLSNDTRTALEIENLKGQI